MQALQRIEHSRDVLCMNFETLLRHKSFNLMNQAKNIENLINIEFCFHLAAMDLNNLKIDSIWTVLLGFSIRKLLVAVWDLLMYTYTRN